MPIYLVALFAASSVYMFNVPGINGWYMNVWWYDIFMHILGGFAVGLLCIVLARAFFPYKNISRRYIIIGTLIVGIGWELFEIYFNLTGHPIGSKLYYIDTIIDLIDDVIGGFLAAYVFTKFRKGR